MWGNAVLDTIQSMGGWLKAKKTKRRKKRIIAPVGIWRLKALPTELNDIWLCWCGSYRFDAH